MINTHAATESEICFIKEGCILLEHVSHRLNRILIRFVLLN